MNPTNSPPESSNSWRDAIRVLIAILLIIGMVVGCNALGLPITAGYG